MFLNIEFKWRCYTNKISQKFIRTVNNLITIVIILFCVFKNRPLICISTSIRKILKYLKYSTGFNLSEVEFQNEAFIKCRALSSPMVHLQIKNFWLGNVREKQQFDAFDIQRSTVNSGRL